MRRRVVVTGLGMVTPLGVGVASTWKGVAEGRSGVGPVRRFDASTLPVTFAAEAPDPGGDASLDLKLRLAAAAIQEALEMSGPLDGERTGVCVGSEIGRPDLRVVAERLRTGELPTSEEISSMDPAAPTRLAASLAGAR